MTAVLVYLYGSDDQHRQELDHRCGRIWAYNLAHWTWARPASIAILDVVFLVVAEKAGLVSKVGTRKAESCIGSGQWRPCRRLRADQWG